MLRELPAFAARDPPRQISPHRRGSGFTSHGLPADAVFPHSSRLPFGLKTTSSSRDGLPGSSRDRAGRQGQPEYSPVAFHRNLRVPATAVQELGHNVPVGRTERHASNGAAPPRCAYPDRAWPNVAAEVRQVVVESRIGDLLSVAIDYYNRVLDVGIGIMVYG